MRRSRTCTHDQPLLKFPSLRDWLAENRLARFIAEIIGELHLKPIPEAYWRKDSRGAEGYHPELLVRLLLCGYATGLTSSRRRQECTPLAGAKSPVARLRTMQNAVGVFALLLTLVSCSTIPPPDRAAPSELGIFLKSTGKDDPKDALLAVRDLGLQMVQISKLPDRFYTPEGAREMDALLKETGIHASAVVAVFDGESYKDIQSVQETVGFLPEALMDERIDYTKKCVDFAAALGVKIVTFHMGFLPDDSQDPTYQRMLQALSDIAQYAGAKGVTISLETGQESAEDLLALIDRVQGAEVKVNFDMANLVLYGKDDPPSALRKLLNKTTSVHVKDGTPPKDAAHLGAEQRLGDGNANVKECLRLLHEASFQGPLVIENYMGRKRGTDPLDELRMAKDFVETIRADFQ